MHAVSLLARIHEDESGFSITELLTAMVIGSIVLWALMTLMTTGFSKSVEVTDRAEAAQSGRAAMDRVVTVLDSTVCLDPVSTVTAIPPLIGSQSSPAVVGSDDSYVAFYADLDGASSSPDRYTITYDATTRTLTENRYDSSGTLPSLTFPANPSSTRVLATDVVQADVPSGTGKLPIFRYYKFETNGTINGALPMTTPVSQTAAGQVVRMLIAFEVISRRTKVEDRRSTLITGQSAIGTPDPNTPNAGSCP